MAARLEGRRWVAHGDPGELVGRGASSRDVSGRDRDLHLRREEPSPSPAIPGLIGHGRVDRDGRGPGLALGQPDQGEGRLRRSTARVRLTEGRLGALEVAPEPADVADRVEAVGLWRRGVERSELGRGPLQLLLGPLPATADRRHFGAVDPADAGKAGEGLSLAVLLGRLDPLARPAIVGQVAARTDQPAGRHPRRERRQLAIDGRDRRFLHQGEPIQRGARCDLQGAEIGLRMGRQVRIGGAGADLHGPLSQRECGLAVAGPRGALAADQREVAVSVRLSVRPEDPLGSAGPRIGDRRLARIAVFASDVEGQVRGAEIVPLRLVRLERPLLGRELDLAMRREEGSLRESLEVGARKVAVAIRLGQELERVGPRVSSERITPRLQWIRGRCDGRRTRLAHGGHCAIRAYGTRRRCADRQARSVAALGRAIWPRLVRDEGLSWREPRALCGAS